MKTNSLALLRSPSSAALTLAGCGGNDEQHQQRKQLEQ